MFHLSSGTDTDRAFDATVGALEEMLLDDEFVSFQLSFLSAHCNEFDDGPENKLSYTPLFERFQSSMEEFISSFLSRRLGPAFSMESFLEECEARGEEQLCGDAFDVLTSMSDFEAFKELMLAEKKQQQWTTTANSAGGSAASAAASAAAGSASGASTGGSSSAAGHSNHQ